MSRLGIRQLQRRENVTSASQSLLAALAAMDDQEQAADDGVRFVWNIWPNNRIDAARVVVPLAVAVCLAPDQAECQAFTMLLRA